MSRRGRSAELGAPFPPFLFPGRRPGSRSGPDLLPVLEENWPQSLSADQSLGAGVQRRGPRDRAGHLSTGR